MASFRIPRLVGKTNGAGLTTWYWQPSKTVRALGWEPRRLGAALGAHPPAEICAAARALNDQVEASAGLGKAQVRSAQRRLTLGMGIKAFAEAGYPSVRKPGETVARRTARQYKSKLKTLDAWGGDVDLASIDQERVAVLRDALMKPAASGPRAGEIRHHAAHETLRVGRTLFRWFEQKRWIPKGANPFADFALAAPGPRDQIWWPASREAIIAAALADHPEKYLSADPGMAVAIDLAFHIGQREADLLALSINQYQEIPAYKMDPEVHRQLAGPDGRVMGIRLRQAKGKRWIEVPVVGESRARLEAQIARARAAGFTNILYQPAEPAAKFVAERAAMSWASPSPEAGQTRFIRRFALLREAAIERARAEGSNSLVADLEDLQFRDFRRTAVVHLGELGIADHLIAAITGHSLDETKKILETYMPRTTGMAARAIALSQARTAPAEQQEKKA